MSSVQQYQYTKQTSRNSRNLKGKKMIQDNVEIDVLQAQLDSIPVDIELIAVKNSRQIQVILEGQVYKTFPSVSAFKQTLRNTFDIVEKSRKDRR